MIKSKGVKAVISISVLIFLFSSCKIVHSLKELNKKKAKVHTYRAGDKELKYLGMHHMGKQQFYDDVKKKIAAYKSEGFIVYYEGVSSHFTTDSILKDKTRRKIRKIMGFSGSYKDNAGSTFKKYVAQPSPANLGLDSNDVRADVTHLQIITEWEKLNRPIILDSLDLHTDFSKKFSKSMVYSKKQYNSIFIEYRNEFLIDLIKSSSSNKILILYGSGHRKDFRKRIRKTLGDKR